jgi:hypothetical protein
MGLLLVVGPMIRDLLLLVVSSRGGHHLIATWVGDLRREDFKDEDLSPLSIREEGRHQAT